MLPLLINHDLTKKITHRRNLRSSPEEKNIALASPPCKGTTFQFFLKDRPAHATRSTTVEVLRLTLIYSTIPNISLEVHHTEISLTDKTKHDNNVPGEIFCYTTQFSDQNITIDQRDSLYAYKATSGPDTMYLHENMNISD